MLHFFFFYPSPHLKNIWITFQVLIDFFNAWLLNYWAIVNTDRHRRKIRAKCFRSSTLEWYLNQQLNSGPNSGEPITSFSRFSTLDSRAAALTHPACKRVHVEEREKRSSIIITQTCCRSDKVTTCKHQSSLNLAHRLPEAAIQQLISIAIWSLPRIRPEPHAQPGPKGVVAASLREWLMGSGEMLTSRSGSVAGRYLTAGPPEEARCEQMWRDGESPSEYPSE